MPWGCGDRCRRQLRHLVNQFTGSLELTQVEGGLADMLASYGVQVGNSLVMDSQNEPFPVSVNREVSGMTVQEIQAINYPSSSMSDRCHGHNSLSSPACRRSR